MTRQFSDGNHIRRFLELDRLLIDERALVVNDNVGIKRTILRSSSRLGVGAAFPREGEAGESTLHLHVRDVATGFASDVQSNRSGGKDGGGDDDSRQSNELRN